ncbi:hypothetical protein LX36DRAFT_174697 [Colletotrichum falcatum]|nr:hypothetical protein LX36DRAFT_174697 [Colletotrichum falcatum]
MDEMEQSGRTPLQLAIGDPPPPYSKEENSRGLPSNPRRRVSGAFGFPQRLSGYGGKTPSGGCYYDLGASRDEKRFRVCTRCILAERTESLHIHDGLGAENDMLATMSRSIKERSYDGKEQEVFNLTLHATEGVEEQAEMYRLGDSKWGRRNTLELVMDVGGLLESFQWRPSRGKEVKGLGGHSSGWKLVRMAPQEAGVGGEGKNRGEGLASDGREVVAAIAPTLSFRKDFVFAFLGSGRSGALGSAWDTAALVSGIWRWWNSVNGSVD